MARDMPATIGQLGQMHPRYNEILRSRGKKAADLARAINGNPSTISKLLNSKRRLGEHWAQRFAQALHTTPAAFYQAPGEPIPAVGLSEAPAALPSPPLSGVDAVSKDEEFAEISHAVLEMLTAAALPTDQRTVARLSKQIERELPTYAALPFAERLGIVLSETRNRLQRQWQSAIRPT